MIPRIIAAALWLAMIALLVTIALLERRDQAEAGNLLIRAGGPWCDVNNPPADPPRVIGPREPRLILRRDQRTIA